MPTVLFPVSPSKQGAHHSSKTFNHTHHENGIKLIFTCTISGQRVRLLSGEKGITIGKNENFEFPLWEIKLENGKILTEARYRFDVLTELQRNICTDGSPIIITTMAEQLKPMNHQIHIFQTEINA
jgi:hypothetical protein